MNFENNIQNIAISENLKGKKVIVGVSGSIAAYKSCDLIRLLRSHGAEVKVIMTAAAVEFISPLTMNKEMWCKQITQQNIQILLERNI